MGFGDGKAKHSSTRGAEKMLAKINAKFRQIEIDREKCSISKRALRILRKKPAQRTDLDLDSIVDELARQMWLEKLPEPVRISKEVFKNILRVVNVQTYSVPEVPIEEEGFPMDTMYIVVGGCMWVHPNDEENAKNEQRQAELGEKSGSGSGDMIGKRKLVPGDVIGEDFWQENNEWTNPFFPGNDGVMCLTLGQEWYERALRPHTEASQKAKVALIKNCYPFANQDMRQCEALAALMTFRSYPCNTTIIRQGDIPNDIFFILKGHCCVVKDLMMPVEELRMLRKPLNPSLISYQSASTSPSDARRQSATTTSGGYGLSGQSGQASFRSTYFRDGSPPRSRLVAPPPMQHSQRFVVATGLDPLYMTPSKRPKTVGRTRRVSRSNLWANSPSSSPRDGPSPDGRPASEPTIRSYDQVRASRSSKTVKPRILFGGPSKPRLLGRRASPSSPLSPGSSGRGSPQSRRPNSPVRNSVYNIDNSDERGFVRVAVELRQLWRGQYFGELGTISKTVRSASVVSMSQVDCLLLSKIDCFRLGFDTGEVSERMATVAKQMQYIYDNGEIRKNLTNQFKWSNYRNDVTSDTVYGSKFAEGGTDEVSGIE